MTSFLEHTAPHYDRMLPAWQLTRSIYTGEGLASYVYQHKQGEARESYQARLQLTDHLGLTAAVLDTLAGVVFEREEDIVRDFGPLGDHNAPGTTAYRIWRDCDGQGTDFPVAMRRLATALLIHNEAWVLVDGPQVGREARISIIPPTAVPNWIDGSEALVKEVVDTRLSIKEKPNPQDQYVLYTTQGWERYRPGASGQIVVPGAREVLIDAAPYSETGRVYMSRSGSPMPPIFRIQLPFARYVAHQLAKREMILTNMTSDRDHLQRSTSYPKLVITAADELFDKMTKSLMKGSSVLQELPEHAGGHRYINPSAEGITVSTATIEAKTKHFYSTAFRLIDAEGRASRTATEAVMERSNGLAAALSMIAASMQEAESTLLHLLAQAYSDRESEWDRADSSWPTDYQNVKLEFQPPPSET